MDQLLAAGLTLGAIRRRVRNGRLHRKAPNVFAVGHPHIGQLGRLWTAVLAHPDGVLSHRTAAALHELVRMPRLVDITIPTHRRSNDIYRTHESLIAPDQITRIDGLPVTSWARTMLDFAENARDREVEKALDQSEVLRIFDLHALQPLVLDANGRRGAPKLQRALVAHGGGLTLTRSELEEAFLALIRRANLPLPEVNAHLFGFQWDFVWREHRLLGETDGAAFHATIRQRERDYERDSAAAREGFGVERFSWRQVLHRPLEVEQRLRSRGL